MDIIHVWYPVKIHLGHCIGYATFNYHSLLEMVDEKSFAVKKNMRMLRRHSFGAEGGWNNMKLQNICVSRHFI